MKVAFRNGEAFTPTIAFSVFNRALGVWVVEKLAIYISRLTVFRYREG
jgi:hypothetical protein